MRRYLFLTLVFLYISVLLKAEHVIHMTIDSARFDSIKLVMNPSGKNTYIDGVNDQTKGWNFQIPDNVFSTYTLSTFLGFRQNQKDSLEVSVFVFESDTVKKISDMKSNSLYMDNLDTIRLPLVLVETQRSPEVNVAYLNLQEGVDPQIPLSILLMDRYFFWGASLSGRELANNYIQITKRYSDSYAMAKLINMTKDDFELNDIKALYDIFTERIKLSDQGLFLKDYIDRKEHFTRFENMRLPDWKTNEPEYIIQDTTKNTLVIFSASWCAPCRALIPVYKMIYERYRNNLNVVYVSTDGTKTTNNWKKLMQTEEIPWLSLVSGDKKGEVAKQYFITSVPTTYLVAPNGSIKKVSIRSEDDVDSFYLYLK